MWACSCVWVRERERERERERKRERKREREMFTTHRDRKHPLQKDCIFATLRFNSTSAAAHYFSPSKTYFHFWHFFFQFSNWFVTRFSCLVTVVVFSKNLLPRHLFLQQIIFGSSTWDDHHSDNLFSPFFHQRTGILMGRIKSGELQLWFTENCFLGNCLNLTMQWY